MHKFLSLTICAVSVFMCTQKLFCQTTQSSIYDAIEILNAKHGLNVLRLPLVGFDDKFATVDPITGKKREPQTEDTNNVDQGRNIILSILKRNANLPSNASDEDVEIAYGENPFLKNVLDSLPVKDNSFINIKIKNISASSEAGSGAKLLGNIANGAADFLIKRGEEELSISVFEKLQKFIEHYPEFKILFPRTVSLIESIPPEDYSNTLKMLKDAIQEDLNQFNSRIPDLYTLPKYQLLNKEVPSLTLVFASSTLITSIDGRYGISQTLNKLGAQKYLTEQNNYSSFIKIICLSSNSLRKKLLNDKEDGNYNYISSDEINSMIPKGLEFKEELARYYLGLLYQQCRTIQISDGSTQIAFSKLFDPLINKTSKAFDILTKSIDKIQVIDSQLVALKSDELQTSQYTGKNTKKAGRYILYADLIGSTLDLIEPFVDGNSDSSTFKRELKEIQMYWKPFTTDAIDMVKAFDLKEYGLAIRDLGNLLQITSKYLEDINNDKIKTKATQLQNELNKSIIDSLSIINTKIKKATDQINGLSKIDSKTTAWVAAKIQSNKQSLEAKVKELLAQKSILDWQSKNADKVLFKMAKVLQYINLLVSISQTENSQDVEALLESVALPSGSSRIKKVTNFNIAVNAYVGAFFLRSNTGGNGFTNQYGLTAPIGFTMSHGFNKGGSISLFAGVFDIGGIIKYKLNNQGGYDQGVTLAGIVSPSVHLAYGFPFFWPITIGAGVQWTTPSTTTSNSIQLSPHFNAFIGIDIPLFNVTTVKKKNR